MPVKREAGLLSQNAEEYAMRRRMRIEDKCPMILKLALKNDGSKLNIVEKMENHNHPVNRDI